MRIELFIFFCLLLSSCCSRMKCDECLPEDSFDIKFYAKNYSREELDSFIVCRTRVQTLQIDTYLFTPVFALFKQGAGSSQSMDTGFVFKDYNLKHKERKDYSYILYNEHIQSSLRINNIVSKFEKGSNCCECDRYVFEDALVNDKIHVHEGSEAVLIE